jgi:hypothetical protein
MKRLICFVAVLLFSLCLSPVFGHEGPDPIAHWKFDRFSVQNNQDEARLGPDGKLKGRISIQKDELGESAYFNGSAETGWSLGYHDDNEFFPMRGRIREVAVYDIAAKVPSKS